MPRAMLSAWQKIKNACERIKPSHRHWMITKIERYEKNCLKKLLSIDYVQPLSYDLKHKMIKNNEDKMDHPLNALYSSERDKWK